MTHEGMMAHEGNAIAHDNDMIAHGNKKCSWCVMIMGTKIEILKMEVQTEIMVKGVEHAIIILAQWEWYHLKANNSLIAMKQQNELITAWVPHC